MEWISRWKGDIMTDRVFSTDFLKEETIMVVLAIGCHPDDIEISCAGTLLKCQQRGDKVVMCHVANGNLGHVIIQPDELRKILRILFQHLLQNHTPQIPL